MASLRLPAFWILSLLLGFPFSLIAQESEAEAIERVLRSDRQISQEATAEAEQKIHPEIVLKNQIQRMRQIDLEGTPLDFREAYVKHIHAWEGVQEELSAQLWANWNNLLFGVFGLFIGQPEVAAQGLTPFLSDQGLNMSAVKSTREKVELIAVRHGANIGD